ncbi:MAG TPA: hypothetical protein VFZ65_08390 [Planctomycetota bacterium]|nr:hypothetical protein [Planctomycetota bacterium]
MLTTWLEITSNATSRKSVDDDHRLAGVVAPSRARRELFRIQLDITAGRLPKRRPRFAFLDQRALPDDE